MDHSHNDAPWEKQNFLDENEAMGYLAAGPQPERIVNGNTEAMRGAPQKEPQDSSRAFLLGDMQLNHFLYFVNQ